MVKWIPFRVQNTTTDDYLIELSRAGDINVIADVTEIPNDEELLSYDKRMTILGVGHYLGGKLNLRMQTFDEQSLLFWPNPDNDAIAALIEAEQKSAPNPAFASLSDVEAPKKWDEYFRQAHNWNGQTQNTDIQVAVDDLPTDLRSQLHQEIQRRLDEQPQYQSLRTLQSPEFWDKTFLFVKPYTRFGGVNSPTEPYLMLWNRTSSIHGSAIADVPLGSLHRRPQ